MPASNKNPAVNPTASPPALPGESREVCNFEVTFEAVAKVNIPVDIVEKAEICQFVVRNADAMTIVVGHDPVKLNLETVINVVVTVTYLRLVNFMLNITDSIVPEIIIVLG
jgi:hypothetical protein